MSNATPATSRNQPQRPRGLLVGAWIVLAAIVLAASIGAGRWMRSSADGASAASLPVAATTTASAQHDGELLYYAYCVKCHGPRGHGDPESLLRLQPPPRDFAGDDWRFERSAASIRRVIREGIPATAMPAAGHVFSDAQLDALADYVLLLADTSASDGRERESSSASVVFRTAARLAPAPALKLMSTNGDVVTLADFRGQVVLVNFWGVDCVHCLPTMPDLAQLADDFADRGLVVLNVCADEPEIDRAAEIAGRVAPGFPVYTDAAGLARQQYEVTILPTCWLIDRNGNPVARAQGAIEWNSPAVRGELEAVIEALSADESNAGLSTSNDPSAGGR